MPGGPIPVDDAVPLLGHEDEEGKAEIGINKGLSQTLGGLLGVTDLRVVGTLCIQMHGVSVGGGGEKEREVEREKMKVQDGRTEA